MKKWPSLSNDRNEENCGHALNRADKNFTLHFARVAPGSWQMREPASEQDADGGAFGTSLGQVVEIDVVLPRPICIRRGCNEIARNLLFDRSFSPEKPRHECAGMRTAEEPSSKTSVIGHEAAKKYYFHNAGSTNFALSFFATAGKPDLENSSDFWHLAAVSSRCSFQRVRTLRTIAPCNCSVLMSPAN